MPRDISATIREMLDRDYGETHDVVDIILPLRPGETEDSRVKYYLAAASNLSFNGNAYQPLLRAIGTIKFSLGKAPDSSDITLENVSKTFGYTLSDTTRRLDGAKVIIRRLFRTSAPDWEGIDLFYGYIRDVKITQDTVSVSIVSDMSRRSAQVASRSVTQRCIWTFRGAECGWTPDQPGNSTFCNKVFEHEEGCSGHSNQPRFGGVPTLSPKIQEIINTGTGIIDGGSTDGGYGYGDNTDGTIIFDPDRGIWGRGGFIPIGSSRF